MTDVPIKELRDAANRCDQYIVQFGVLIHWELHPMGLKLTAEHGAERIHKYIDWGQLEYATDQRHLLRKTEEAALQGLSP